VVVKDGLDGKRVIIKRIGEKELVAAAQAFSGAKIMRVRVEADAPSKVLILNAERVGAPCCNACAFHTRLVRNVMRILAAKTLELNAKIEILSHRTTEERLLAYLHSFADKCGKSEFDIPFDRQQLADFLCVERSALSAEISRLARAGSFDCHKNHFKLT
jgi:CRP-like cAMP-binding protein